MRPGYKSLRVRNALSHACASAVAGRRGCAASRPATDNSYLRELRQASSDQGAQRALLKVMTTTAKHHSHSNFYAPEPGRHSHGKCHLELSEGALSSDVVCQEGAMANNDHTVIKASRLQDGTCASCTLSSSFASPPLCHTMR